MHVGRLEVGRTWTRGGGAMTTQRHLAAILACDVVGYSRLTERDERGTLERLKIYRKDLLEPLVSEHQGRIVKLMVSIFPRRFAEDLVRDLPS